MLILLSPAKKLDFRQESRYTQNFSLPLLVDQAQELVRDLARMSSEELASLMGISPQLAELNAARFREFELPFHPGNAKQAILCFSGEVYQQIKVAELKEADYQYAQQHLRILSGLYGLLRPLDLIQPYRLEMGTRLPNAKGKDLYEFWGNDITEALRRELAAMPNPVVVNLASHEYFKSVKPRGLQARVVTPLFKEDRGKELKTIFLYAKQARGTMARFAIDHRLEDPETLKSFDGMGYQFRPELSSEDEWIFVR